MKTRTLFLLLGAFLLLGLVALLAENAQRSRHTKVAGGRLFPKLEAAKVVKIEVKSNDKASLLEKKDGAWKVMPEGFAADEDAVKQALEKLEKTDKAELASHNPEKHVALEVKEGDAKSLEVKVWTDAAAGAPAADFFIGKSGGDFQSNFVRLQGEPAVWRTTDLLRPAFDRPRGWRDHTVLKFTPEDATRLELTSAEGHFVLEKKAAEKSPAAAPQPGASPAPAPMPAAPLAEWTLVEPEPGPARETTVDSAVRALSALTADEFATTTDVATTGLDAPSARARVTLKDGRSLEVVWGKDATAGRVFAKRADVDTVYELGGYRKNSVFPKADTLKPEAPAAAAPEGAGDSVEAPPPAMH